MKNILKDYDLINELRSQGWTWDRIVGEVAINFVTDKKGRTIVKPYYTPKSHLKQVPFAKTISALGRQKIDEYSGPMKDLIFEAMVANGQNPIRCSECTSVLNGANRNIHHTRYKNATVKDLRFVCHKCNSATHNRGLK